MATKRVASPQPTPQDEAFKAFYAETKRQIDQKENEAGVYFGEIVGSKTNWYGHIPGEVRLTGHIVSEHYGKRCVLVVLP